MSYQIAVEPTNSAVEGRACRYSSSTSITVSPTVSDGMNGMAVKPRQLSSSARGDSTCSTMKVKRRLHAFFVQEEGDEARVAFVDSGELIHYYLPLKLLKEAGVYVENQPFELDEYEATLDGVAMSGYKVRSAADVRDSYEAPLPLDDERKKKLEYILNRNWDAED